MGAAIDYRLRIEDTRDPKGPDGRGWNRLAIFGLDSHARCSRRPATRQGALDTLRGMARFGNPLAYQDCVSSLPCAQCRIATAPKEPWNSAWHLREDAQGLVWLLGDIAKGFGGYGYCYKGWGALLADVDVPMLQRRQDAQGFYWVEA